MTGRNDPCPCGSGRKYKHCHMEEDQRVSRPLRLVRGGASPGEPGGGAPSGPGGVRLPEGAVVADDYWEVDLMPLRAGVENDPTARPSLLLVGAGDYVLHAEVVAHPPADLGDLVSLLLSAVDAANRTAGTWPQVLLVRHAPLADLLELIVHTTRHPLRETHIGVSTRLVRVDDAFAGFEDSSGIPRAADGGQVLVSHANTWAAWGLPTEIVAGFFTAAAAYHRAAPWRALTGEHALTVSVTRGNTWAASVMGEAGEVFGLALHADPMDLARLQGFGIAEEDGAPLRLRGQMLSLGFEDRQGVPKAMREEVRRAGWALAGPRAYPLLMVLNAPGGCLELGDLLDLTAALRAIPGFVAKHEAVLRGEAKGRYPLRHADRAAGATVMMRATW